MPHDREVDRLVTGGKGQLGAALGRRNGMLALPSDVLDVTNPESVRTCLVTHRPRVVVNAAAYTSVDAAEGASDLADAINAYGPRALAEACDAAGIRLAHVSTDFVFDGTASRPIPPEAVPNPLSAYGRSKLRGEVAVRQVLGADALVVRTAWVYASGHRNFVATMLQLMRSRKEIAVVADQVGTPTWAETLADGLERLVEEGARGTQHLTDSGVASWYDFAVAIEEFGRRYGILEQACRVNPIRTEDYPTLAIRPAYSVLDKTSSFEIIGGPTPHWRESLERCLADWRDPE